MNIVVCLSTDRSFFSGMTYLTDGGGFTHASLGLEESAEYYYSFNFKGMKKEYRTSLKKRPRLMLRYIVTVPDEAWQKLKEIISEMEKQREKYQYAKLGVYLRLFHLPNEAPKEDHFFCSQFVAAVLKASGCVEIKKDPAQCTPNDLLQELIDSGQICRVEEESELVNPGEAAIDLAVGQMEKGHEKLTELASKNLTDALEAKNASVIPALALKLGLDQLNPLYKKLVDKIGIAEDAVGDSPERLAKLTSGLLKNGAEKLLDVKEKVEDTLLGEEKKTDDR